MTDREWAEAKIESIIFLTKQVCEYRLLQNNTVSEKYKLDYEVTANNYEEFIEIEKDMLLKRFSDE